MSNPDQASAITAGIREIYDRQAVAPHAHERAQVMFAERGALAVTTGEGLWMLPPTRALFVPGGLAHGLAARGRVDLATLYIAPDAPGLPDWTTCKVIDVNPLLREVILRLVDLPWTYCADKPAGRLAKVLMDELVSLAGLPFHLPEPRDPRAVRFCRHMQDHIDDRRRLTEIAAEHGTTARTLERCFQREIGMSTGAWVQQLRLLNAVQMLTLGEPVGDVAFALGYANPSSFIVAFRLAFGTSPGQYIAKEG
ncbi:MAG: helix-turn-helix transcriptional regulator [Pseudomonadota bacterium]